MCLGGDGWCLRGREACHAFARVTAGKSPEVPRDGRWKSGRRPPLWRLVVKSVAVPLANACGLLRHVHGREGAVTTAPVLPLVTRFHARDGAALSSRVSNAPYMSKAPPAYSSVRPTPSPTTVVGPTPSIRPTMSDAFFTSSTVDTTHRQHNSHRTGVAGSTLRRGRARQRNSHSQIDLIAV